MFAAVLSAVTRYVRIARGSGDAIAAIVDAHHLLSGEALAAAETPLDCVRRVKALWDTVADRHEPLPQFRENLARLPERAPPRWHAAGSAC